MHTNFKLNINLKMLGLCGKYQRFSVSFPTLCRQYIKISQSSLLWRHFEYVSRETEAPKPSLAPATINKNLNQLLINLDKTFADENIKNLTGTKDYLSAVRAFPEILSRSFASKDQLIKMLFYVGLQKSKQAEGLSNNLINRLQKHFPHLTIEDICIMSSSIFKCSVSHINSSANKLISATIHKNFEELLARPAELVCLIKTLRQQKHYDYELLNRLDNSSGEWLKNSIPFRAHMLAYFAESKCLPGDFNKIFTDCIRDCDKKEFECRDKDIARILWTASFLGAEINEEEANLIWKIIDSNLKALLKNPSLLIDCLQSMAIMEKYSTNLTALVVDQKCLEKFKRTKKSAPWMRLRIYLEMLKIERGVEINVNGPVTAEPTPDQKLHERPDLKRIYFCIKCLESKLKLSSVKCAFSVPMIFDADICIQSQDRKVIIEVMDSNACLYKSEKPTGHYKSKLRLLKKLYKHVIIVTPDELAMANGELFEKIETKVSAVLQA